MKKRNGLIDYVKFITAIYIVLFHYFIYTKSSGLFRGGAYGVEIFCLISGAFFFLKIRKEPPNSTWSYTQQRFMRFFPYTFFAFLLMFIYTIVTGNKRSLTEIIGSFVSLLPEVFLFGMGGVNAGKAFLNSPVWTVSCMLIVESLIVGFLISCKNSFFNIVLPFSILLTYSIQANISLVAVNPRIWLGFTTTGVLQVWAGECFGIITIILSDKLKRIKKKSKIFTIMEIGSYLMCFVIMIYCESIYWKMLLTVFSMLGVSITISDKSYSGIVFKDTKISRYLGRISFAIYLNHSLLLKIFQRYLGAEYMSKHIVLFLIALVICAAVYDYVMGVILKKILKPMVSILKRKYMQKSELDVAAIY